MTRPPLALPSRLRRIGAIVAIAAAAPALSACVSIDWEATGRLWLGSLCDAVQECSWDADGDPHTPR